MSTYTYNNLSRAGRNQRDGPRACRGAVTRGTRGAATPQLVTGDPPSPHQCASYGAASWNGTLSAFGWTRTAGLDALTVDGQNATVFEQGEWTAKGLAVPAGESTLTVTRTDVDQTVQQAQTTVSRPAGQTAYSHDLNGNMLGQGKWAFSWNDENRLVEAVAEGESRLTFVYDGQGRRRTKSEYSWDNGQWVLLRETRYIWDGWLCLQHRIDEDGETATETYLRGLDLSGSLEGAGGIGGMLAVTRCPDPVLQVPCALLLFFDNGRGDITELADPVTGAVVAHYECSPFGKLLVSSGPLADANPYRFSSKEHDATGLAYYGYRYYSPELGRWINRDPIGESGGINLLALTRNRPTCSVDAVGLYEVEIRREREYVHTGPWVFAGGYESWREDLSCSSGFRRLDCVLHEREVRVIYKTYWDYIPDEGEVPRAPEYRGSFERNETETEADCSREECLSCPPGVPV